MQPKRQSRILTIAGVEYASNESGSDPHIRHLDIVEMGCKELAGFGRRADRRWGQLTLVGLACHTRRHHFLLVVGCGFCCVEEDMMMDDFIEEYNEKKKRYLLFYYIIGYTHFVLLELLLLGLMLKLQYFVT